MNRQKWFLYPETESEKRFAESWELGNRLVDFLEEDATIGEKMECGWLRSRSKNLTI